MAGHLFRLLSHGSTTRSIRTILAWNIHLDFQFGDLHLHLIIYGYAKITPFVQIGISLRIYPLRSDDHPVYMAYYDAFYWYNGAMYYTLFYSMSLFLASLLIGYQLSSSKFKKALIGGASIVLSIIIAGGNFVSGLGMGAILFAAILIMKMEQRRWPRLYITILAIYGIAFLFSVLAPGNAFRQPRW